MNEISALRFVKQTSHIHCLDNSYYSLSHHLTLWLLWAMPSQIIMHYICTNYLHDGDLFNRLFKDVSLITFLDWTNT